MEVSVREVRQETPVDHANVTLRALGTAVEMGRGRVVFLQGDHDDRLFLVDNGRVRLSMDVGHGQEFILTEVGAGSVFGGISALDSRPRPSTATTLTPTRLVEVPGHRFRQAVDSDPRLAAFMLAELSGEVRRSIGQLAVRCGMTTRARVAGQLLSMLQWGRDPGDGRVAITQDALAEWVGTTRESAARALAELRADGSISTGRGWVRVLDRGALARSMG